MIKDTLKSLTFQCQPEARGQQSLKYKSGCFKKCVSGYQTKCPMWKLLVSVRFGQSGGIYVEGFQNFPLRLSPLALSHVAQQHSAEEL